MEYLVYANYAYQKWRPLQSSRGICILWHRIVGNTLALKETPKIDKNAFLLLKSIQKLVSYTLKREKLVSVIQWTRNICVKHIVGSRADVIRYHLRKTYNFFKLYALGVALSCILFVVSPIKEYFVDNELTLLMPLDVVFIDESTIKGFLIANLILATLGLLAADGVAFYGCGFVYCMGNYSMQIDIIGEDFKDLDEMWTDETAVPIAYKRAYLKNICMKCQDMEEYGRNIASIKFINTIVVLLFQLHEFITGRL